MRKSILATILLASLPTNAYEIIGVDNHYKPYDSQRGYAYEKKCFRFEYREDYIPGTSVSPGYVKSYKEKVLVPCNSNNNALNHYREIKKTRVKYVDHNSIKKCTGNTTLGGLLGGGFAASLSKKDAYSWSIPLGAVLGAGIGNAGCK